MRFYLFFLFSAILLSCSEQRNISPDSQSLHVEYSFFVAGHIYGHPGSHRLGFHPPFKAKLPMINNIATMELGVLTGDIVRIPSNTAWDAIDEDVTLLVKEELIPDTSLSQLADIDLIPIEKQLPIYFVVGNHDIQNRPLFHARYGASSYHFTHRNDLFIVLDPNLDGWNITGNQLETLKQTLAEKAASSNNIYVFFHQQLWYSTTNIFSKVKPNSLAGMSDSLNFWTEIEPLFHELPNQVVMFAGDAGAFTFQPSFMYYKYDNITFIASGMGNKKSDNLVILDVMNDKSIRYRLIALNGDDIDALGKLEDYVLP